jgi:hypothetical protein
MATTALIVTHHIYLTQEERYKLSQPGAVVEVMGVSSPVWVKKGKWVTETAHEVFCNYEIVYSDQPEKNTVRVRDDGYLITLTDTMPSHLLNVNDNGSMCLMLTHRNYIKKEGKSATAIHCLVIEDISVLKKTLA